MGVAHGQFGHEDHHTDHAWAGLSATAHPLHYGPQISQLSVLQHGWVSAVKYSDAFRSLNSIHWPLTAVHAMGLWTSKRNWYSHLSPAICVSIRSLIPHAASRWSPRGVPPTLCSIACPRTTSTRTLAPFTSFWMIICTIYPRYARRSTFSGSWGRTGANTAHT